MGGRLRNEGGHRIGGERGVPPSIFRISARRAGDAPVSNGKSREPRLSNAGIVSSSAEVGERFRLVFEAAPSALLMSDEGGVIIMVNTRAEQLFGYPRAELIGQKVEVLVPERQSSGSRGRRDESLHASIERCYT